MSIIVSYVNSIFFFSLYISLFYITFKVLFFLPVPIIPHFVYGDHHMMFFRGKNLCFLGEKKLYFSYAYLFWYVSLFPFSISNLLSSQGMLGFPKQAKYMNSLQIITVKFFFSHQSRFITYWTASFLQLQCAKSLTSDITMIEYIK